MTKGLSFRAFLFFPALTLLWAIPLAAVERDRMNATVTGLNNTLAGHIQSVTLPPASRPRSSAAGVRIRGTLFRHGAVTVRFTSRRVKTWQTSKRLADGTAYEDISEPMFLTGSISGRHGLDDAVTAYWEGGRIMYSFVGRARGSGGRRRIYEVWGKATGDGATGLRMRSRPLFREQCANDRYPEFNLFRRSAAARPRTASGSPGTSAARATDVALVMEETWIARYGADAQARAAQIAMAVDQIFRRDLDIQLNIVGIFDGSGVFTGSNASNVLLPDFAVKAGSGILGVDFDFAMLLQDRPLDPSGGSHTTNGVAYLGGVCTDQARFGTVTARSPNIIQTFAHEAGHNHGADHDAGLIDGQAFLMYFLSLPSRLSQFSSSSMNEISALVNSPAGFCLGGGDGAPQPTPVPDPGSPGSGLTLSARVRQQRGRLFSVRARLIDEQGAPAAGETIGAFTNRRAFIASKSTDSTGAVTFLFRTGPRGGAVFLALTRDTSIATRVLRLRPR